MGDKASPLDPLTAVSLDADSEPEEASSSAHEASPTKKESPVPFLDTQPASATPRDDPEHLAAASVTTMPSYGQLMASSLDDEASFGEEADTPVPLTNVKKRAEPMTIEVTEPLKQVEQGSFPSFTSNYVSYRVITRTTLPSYKEECYNVRRRFKDFVALADLLKLTHRGYFIPPRPEKSSVEGARMSTEFVNLRKDALHHYLNQLAAHPVIRESEPFKVFLTLESNLATSREWTQLHPMTSTVLEGISRLPKQLLGHDRVIPLPTEAAQSAKASGDVMRLIKEGVTALKVDLNAVQASSEDETLLRNERVELEDFQERVIRASRKAEKLVGRMEEFQIAVGDLGLTLKKTSLYERNERQCFAKYSSSGAACAQMAADCYAATHATLKENRLYRIIIPRVTQALSPLHDHLALIPAVKKGLKEREDALLTHFSISQDLEKKKSSIANLQEQEQKTFGGDKSKTRKVTNLQNDVAALETALEAAGAEYEKVKRINLEEVRRLREARSSDFQTMLEQFVSAQADFSDSVARAWTTAVAEIEATKPR